MSGWVKIHRSICNKDSWTKEPFTRGQAWVDMILLANHKPGMVRKRGIRVDVKRGQLGWSIKGLADRWQWSQGKVKRFFLELKMDNQIEEENNRVTTLITIVNYDMYQGNGEQNGEQTENRRRTDGDKQECKERKEGKNTKKKEYPSWLNISLWKEFKEMRSKIKAPLTENSEKRAINKLKGFIDNGHSQEEIITRSVDNCWKSFYEPEGKKEKKVGGYSFG